MSKICEITYPDPERIDFNDYLNSYPDVNNHVIQGKITALKHWIKYGRYEGRHIKLKNVNYKEIEKYIIHDHLQQRSRSKLSLVTSLYNDPNHLRMDEYKLTLRLNLANPAIDKIYIFWDKTSGEPPSWLNYNKIIAIPNSGRPSFDMLFTFCNNTEVNKNWLICNGDIVITKDIMLLEHKCLQNTLLAITRWELTSETETSIFHYNEIPNKFSQDTWIINTPFKILPGCENLFIGEIGCDSNIANIYKDSDTKVFNPCIDIKTLHIHLQNSRSQKYNVHLDGYVEHCNLNDIPDR